ncbi:TRAFs-binding domain-containing protein [Agriterribacter sp.]|uniref:TRAFs-binding domain-containing protein n=1 Tax=Agriterribacter sp. TaxID=2821509 RepID=UPI002C2F4FD7|nr:TRAFs-binding domain-containing protein [Agriterribacter sp.]HRO47940.1 TRAFs-binding domain-containing protein [Agriterribacter sp.]HRQ18621.1 TRAFs-binding domain-containing protein [Agriterribacter sp.]
MASLCFVLMPFGVKTDGNKKEIDFNKVYSSFIKKAIEQAGLLPVRADEEKGGGLIHKPMYERLLYCEFAVADLSFANANVFYELGIRHAVKPYTTVSIFEANTKLPFDVAPLRALPYNFEAGEILDCAQKIKDLSDIIRTNLDAQQAQPDSPISQMIPAYIFPELNTLQAKADSFKEIINETNNTKQQIRSLVKEWQQWDVKDKKAGISDEEKASNEQEKMKLTAQLKAIEKAAGKGLKYNYDLVYALMGAYKTTNAFTEMAAMIQPMVQRERKGDIYLQQQLALALNKTRHREEAEQILNDIINRYGADPETNGLLGAVYKGLTDDNAADDLLAAAYRRKAIKAYLDGFDADPRDFYPGINALTLLFFENAEDPRFKKYFPLVGYSVERQLEAKQNNYWVQATALELAALELNETSAKQYLAAALTCNPAKWEKETTAGNLKKIYTSAALLQSKEKLAWLMTCIEKLG